jgi:hypothetical protein
MSETVSIEQINELKARGRRIEQAVAGDPALGPFALLPGTWANEPALPGRGWNMIALPFAPQNGNPTFRLLLNQYNEILNFFLVDKSVPNRGVGPAVPPSTDPDQHVVTLDYEQGISQIAAEDFPVSGLAGPPRLAIHHEPGLFLNMLDQVEPGGPTIARLATIPHGDAALALGTSTASAGAPVIPTVNSLPIGVNQDFENNPYLAPYKHFHDNLFRGLFDPTDPTALLKAANQGVDIVRTTKLEFDTTVASGGIHNIPFVVAQANASEMKATFWIQELAETDDNGDPILRLQYVQVVQLDFFPRFDGGPGRIKWPHVSINTLVKRTDVAAERALDTVLP